jgi:hypothetical protein
MGQTRLRDMMMPTGPGSRFIMVQANFAFGLFQHSLYRPAPTAQARQVDRRTGDGRVAQVVFHFRSQSEAAADNQPDSWSWQAVAHQRDPLKCKGGDHRSPAAFLDGVAVPASGRQITQPIPHRHAQLRPRLSQRPRPRSTQGWGSQPDARRGRHFGEVPLAQRRHPIQKAWNLDTVATIQDSQEFAAI